MRHQNHGLDGLATGIVAGQRLARSLKCERSHRSGQFRERRKRCAGRERRDSL